MTRNLLFVLLSMSAFTVLNAKEVCGNDKAACQNLSNSCKCYCSDGCGPREKKRGDHPDPDKPVFVEDDPNGNYCYCKQRDLDNYKPNQCKVKDAARKAKQSTRVIEQQ